MRTTVLRGMCILVFISLGLGLQPSALSQDAFNLSFKCRALESSAIHPVEGYTVNTNSTARIQTGEWWPRGSRPVSKWAKTTPTDTSGSTTCDDFQVKWSDPDFNRYVPAEATLVIETSDGDQVLRVSEEVRSPQTIQLLWCKDLLGKGTPVIAYTVYSGGAHCCWNANVVLLNHSLRWLLRANLAWGGLIPVQLDDAGPLELVTKLNVFAVFDDLPSYASPFLPMVFTYNGKSYVEATRRFPGHIRADLADALVDLDGKSFEERAGKALRVLGDYVLLGQEKKGLAEIKAKVSDDVAVWLDKYAAEAVTRVRYRYGFDLYRQK